MYRRRFIAAGSAAGGAVLAGCFDGGSGDGGTTDADAPDLPDGIYVPSHVDGMGMVGMGTAGDYTVGVSFTYPEVFWTVTGANAEKVAVRETDDAHLMATVWDGETGTVLPVGAGVSFAVTRDGDTVLEKSPWPMLAQRMGFHYGDNVALEGDGTYEVTVDVSSMSERRLGAFAGRFGEGGTATVAFEFSAAKRDELMYRNLEDRYGQPGAPDMMDMEMMPTSQVPAESDLPGTVLGSKRTDDAVVVATMLEGVGDGPAYLAVSPRTRYNRIPLPMMSVDATVEADGSTLLDGESLAAAIHPDIGYHYGAALERAPDDPDVTVSPVSPPQTSRHEGYERAFMQLEDVSF